PATAAACPRTARCAAARSAPRSSSLLLRIATTLVTHVQIGDALATVIPTHRRVGLEAAVRARNDDRDQSLARTPSTAPASHLTPCRSCRRTGRAPARAATAAPRRGRPSGRA